MEMLIVLQYVLMNEMKYREQSPQTWRSLKDFFALPLSAQQSLPPGTHDLLRVLHERLSPGLFTIGESDKYSVVTDGQLHIGIVLEGTNVNDSQVTVLADFQNPHFKNDDATKRSRAAILLIDNLTQRGIVMRFTEETSSSLLFSMYELYPMDAKRIRKTLKPNDQNHLLDEFLQQIHEGNFFHNTLRRIPTRSLDLLDRMHFVAKTIRIINSGRTHAQSTENTEAFLLV